MFEQLMDGPVLRMKKKNLRTCRSPYETCAVRRAAAPKELMAPGGMIGLIGRWRVMNDWVDQGLLGSLLPCRLEHQTHWVVGKNSLPRVISQVPC